MHIIGITLLCGRDNSTHANVGIENGCTEREWQLDIVLRILVRITRGNCCGSKPLLVDEGLTVPPAWFVLEASQSDSIRLLRLRQRHDRRQVHRRRVCGAKNLVLQSTPA